MAKISAAKRDEIEKRAAEKFGTAAVEQAHQRQQQAVVDANQEYTALKQRQAAENAKLTRDEKVQRGLRSAGSTVTGQATAPAATHRQGTQQSAIPSAPNTGTTKPIESPPSPIPAEAQYLAESIETGGKRGLEGIYNWLVEKASVTDFVNQNPLNPYYTGITGVPSLVGFSEEMQNEILDGRSAAEYYADGIERAKQTGQDLRSTKYYDEAAQLNEKYGVNPNSVLGYAGSIGQSIGGMAPSIAASMLSGTPLLGSAALFAGASGNATTEALKEGATYDEAQVAGMLSGAAELVSESLVGGIPALGKGWFDKFVAKGIAKAVKNDVARGALMWLASSAGEGLEEVLAEGMESFIPRVYDDEEAAKSVWQTLEENLPNMGTAFVLGAITSGILRASGLSPDALAESGRQAGEQLLADTLVKQGSVTRDAAYNEDGSVSDAIKEMYAATVEAEKLKRAAEQQTAETAQQPASEPVKPAVTPQPTETETALQQAVKPAETEAVDAQLEYWQQENEAKKAADEARQREVQEIAEAINPEAAVFRAPDVVANIDGTDIIRSELDAAEVAYDVKNAAEAFNRKVVIVKSLPRNANAAWHNGTIYMVESVFDPNAKHGPLSTLLFHEITHSLRGAKSWDKFKAYALQQLEARPDIREEVETLYRPDEWEEEYVAHYVERVLFQDQEAVNALARAQRSTAQRIWENLKSIAKGFGRKATAEQRAILKAERMFAKALAQTENPATDGEAMFKLVGNKNGKDIFVSNFPPNTAKGVKAQRVIDLVQNVWSKKPITIAVRNANGETKIVSAQFDPKLEERSDLSKMAFGNRKGNGSERRVTSELVDDWYYMAERAVPTWGKEEVGKTENPAHDEAQYWYYLNFDFLYRENGIDIPYTMHIDIKEKPSGSYFYSFSAEKTKELRPSEIPSEVTTDGGNEILSNNHYAQPPENVNPSAKFSLPDTDSQYMAAVESGDTETAQRMVKEAAEAAGYNEAGHHGTRRGDRVGNVFLPDRATSGPFAYFTDNREIAENYSRDKADTSTSYDERYDNYHTQFRVQTADGDVAIEDIWYKLPLKDRNEIARRAAEITFDDDYENIITVSGNKRGTGGFEQNLREARGNALKALVTEWLDSGTLYGDEARFNEVLDVSGISDILERAGYGKVEYFDPDAAFERVYDVYMRAQNPFDTQQVDEAFVEDFMRWYSEQDANAYARESANADSWDKNNITAEQFAERMRDDIANNRTNAWTSIPDSMSDYLRSKGFDIIKDAGGKQGGAGHTVWIPLGDSNSVKSSDPVTYDDNGNVIPLSQRFNPESRDIRYSLPSERQGARGSIDLREAVEQRWHRNRIKQGIDWLEQYIVSGQKPIENLSEDAAALVDAARRTGGVTQYIAEEQLVSPDGDIMGAPSYVEMFVEAVPQDQRESFDDYRKHLHNIDRMSLENDMELTAAVDEYNAFINEYPEYENFNDSYLKRIAKEGGDGNLAERYLALRDMVETLKAEKNKPVMAHEVDGKMVPYTAEESAEIVAEYDAQHPEWADIVAEQNAWWDTFNQMWLVETGLVSPQAYAALREKYPNYMPTYRVDGKKGGMSSFGNLFTHNAIKQAKGSTAEVLPYYQQYIEQIERVIKMQRRNEIGQYLVEYAMQDPRVAARQGIAITQDAGDIIDIVNNEGDLNDVEKAGLKELDNGTYQFSVKVNGENVTLNLSKEMCDAVDWLYHYDHGAFMNALVKFGRWTMRGPKKFITTHSPIFVAKNFVRDLQTYMANNSAPVGRGAKYYVKAAAEIAHNGEAYQQLKALGGLSEGYYSTEKAYKLPKNTALTKVKKYLPHNLIAYGGEFVESIPRLAEYMALRDKYGDTPAGRRKAALGASDVTTNFARTAPGSQLFNAFVLFWNAGVQGADKTVRQLKSAPLRTLVKAAGMQVLVSALLARGVRDNPHYDDLDDEVKDNYFLIPNIFGEQDENGYSKTFIRLPRSREYGVLLGASVARIIDGLNDGDLGGEDTFEELSEWLGSVGAGFMPPDIMDNNIFNTFTRIDLFDPDSPGETWYGGPIVPPRLQKYSPNEQYDVGTSGLSRELAHGLNWVNDYLPLYPDLSPEKLDDLFDTYGGIWADMAMGLTSPKNKGETAGETVGNALTRAFADPWVRGFASDPRYSSGVVDEFYDFLSEAEMAANDLNKQFGIPSPLVTPEEAAYKELSKLSSILSELYAEERAVYEAPGSAKEKNERSKQIREEINETIRNYETLYNTAYASAQEDWAEAERIMPRDDIYSLAESIDADGNGYWKNEERQAAIDSAKGLTEDEKAYLWLFFGGSDKSNPYD